MDSPKYICFMKNKSFYCLLIATLISTVGIAQTFQVFKGDTINRLDKQKQKQGLWRKYFQTDTLFSEGVYENNVPVGVFYSYHPNGKIQAKLSYSGKTNICKAEVYSDEGVVIAIGKYVDQKKDSLWTYFDEKGILTAKDFYVKGRKEGLSTVYYPNGKQSRAVTYKADIMSGPFNEYFESGSPKVQATMLNGEFIGQALVFHPNGNIWQKGNYENGLKHGIWIILKDNGSVEKEEQYSKGKLLNPSSEEE